MEERLEHLYEVQGLSRRLRESRMVDPDPISAVSTSTASSSAGGPSTATPRSPFVKNEEQDDEGDSFSSRDFAAVSQARMPVKEEEEDSMDDIQLSRPDYGGGGGASPPLSSSPTTTTTQTTPLSSSPGARDWSRVLPEASHMNGRMAQLSLEESLALSARESERRSRVVQQQHFNSSNNTSRVGNRYGARSDELRTMLYATVGDDDDGYRATALDEEEEQYDGPDEFDWHRQGYYDEGYA